MNIEYSLKSNRACRQHALFLSKSSPKLDVIANQCALNCGMIATGNHGYSDPLRDAPLVWRSPKQQRNLSNF